MKRYMRFVAMIVLASIVSNLAPAAPASAAIPYEGYTLHQELGDVHSLNGYVYVKSFDGYDMSSGPFKDPEDIFVGPDDTLYVADAGNSRIVHFNKEGKVLSVFGEGEGEGKLSEPKGVYVKDDGTVYVADTKNQRIAVFGPSGELVQSIGAPQSNLLGSTFSYSPSKLVIDQRNYLLVISDGNTQGVLQIDAKGEFKGFFGANHIGFSWQRLLQRFIATQEQKDRMRIVRPMEFSNIDIDDEGFLYSTTLGSEFNQIKRLSPVGVDTLNIGVNRKYGDMFDVGPFDLASFVGISVSKDGLISGLDLQTNKVFQYDKLGNLLFVFGGLGDQNGLFKAPVSIAQTSDGIIAVVDKGRNRIDLFRPTPFALLVQEASRLYVDGRFDEAESLWLEVLRQNGNYDMAYHAIGKALYNAEKYGEAMKYFKLAKAKGDYSVAFKEYRKELMREHFGWVVLAFFVLLAGVRYGIPKLLKWIFRPRKGVGTSGVAVEGEGV